MKKTILKTVTLTRTSFVSPNKYVLHLTGAESDGVHWSTIPIKVFRAFIENISVEVEISCNKLIKYPSPHCPPHPIFVCVCTSDEGLGVKRITEMCKVYKVQTNVKTGLLFIGDRSAVDFAGFITLLAQDLAVLVFVLYLPASQWERFQREQIVLIHCWWSTSGNSDSCQLLVWAYNDVSDLDVCF